MVETPSASVDGSWIPELGIYTLKKQTATAPVFLSGECYGQRNLVRCP